MPCTMEHRGPLHPRYTPPANLHCAPIGIFTPPQPMTSRHTQTPRRPIPPLLERSTPRTATYNPLVRFRPPDRRHKQAGRAILRLLGDRGEILFPDLGARPLKIHFNKYRRRPDDPHGSHMNGKHKLG